MQWDRKICSAEGIGGDTDIYAGDLAKGMWFSLQALKYVNLFLWLYLCVAVRVFIYAHYI